jgi:hypothetical protein
MFHLDHETLMIEKVFEAEELKGPGNWYLIPDTSREPDESWEPQIYAKLNEDLFESRAAAREAQKALFLKAQQKYWELRCTYENT